MELTLSQIRKRAEKRLSKIERENNLEPLVEIAYVGMEEMGEGKIVYSATARCTTEPLQFKGIGLTPEAAVNNCMAQGFLIMLRLESNKIRETVKELLG